MLPGMNPRKMQAMMRRMGIQQVDIPAVEVIIRTPDKELVISDPSVAKVNMMGNETFQISGKVQERALSNEPTISEEDIKTVMEQAQVDEAQAKASLEKHKGDLAAAIIDLKGQFFQDTLFKIAFVIKHLITDISSNN